MAKLLFFGRLSDITGQLETNPQLPEAIQTTEALRQWLGTEYKTDFTDRTLRIAVNGAIVSEPAPLKNTDEIALMPPVGGG